MKYLLGPFFKYLLRFLKLFLQIILAVILTVCWGIPTLIWCILYFIGVSLWEFKITFYKLNSYKIKWSNDSISEFMLWSEQDIRYKTYFHCIWNLSTRRSTIKQIINRLQKQLN